MGTWEHGIGYFQFYILNGRRAVTVHSYLITVNVDVGSGGRALERRTVNRGDGGSIPPTAVSKLRQFRSPVSFGRD